MSRLPPPEMPIFVLGASEMPISALGASRPAQRVECLTVPTPSDVWMLRILTARGEGALLDAAHYLHCV